MSVCSFPGISQEIGETCQPVLWQRTSLWREYGQSTHQISSQYRLDSGLVLVVTTSSDRTLTLIQLLSEHIVRDADAVEGYAAWAQTYDLEVNPLIGAEEPRVQRIFKEVPMSTAIDVGTGTGRHAIVLAKRGVAVTAVDQSPEMLSVARQKAAREGFEIDFRTGSLDDRLPSEDEHYRFPGLCPGTVSCAGHQSCRQGVHSSCERGRFAPDF